MHFNFIEGEELTSLFNDLNSVNWASIFVLYFNLWSDYDL